MAAITTPSLTAFAGQEFLRSSYFLTRFDPISFLGPELQRDIMMLCESVEFPGITATTTDYRMAGLNRIKVPYSKDYPDVTLTFLNSVKYDMYWRFINWVRYATSTEWQNGNATTVPYFDEFTSSFSLIQFNNEAANERFSGLTNILSSIDRFNQRFLNSENLFETTRVGNSLASIFNSTNLDTKPRTPSYTVQFYNAYPTSVQSIQSNWADDNFQRITVSFTYEYYVIKPLDDAQVSIELVSE